MLLKQEAKGTTTGMAGSQLCRLQVSKPQSKSLQVSTINHKLARKTITVDFISRFRFQDSLLSNIQN